jgi:hypothetical protein
MLHEDRPKAACGEGKRWLMYRWVTRKPLYFRSLNMRALATTLLLALPTAAMAGTPATPGPEAGVGAAAMAAVAAGYLFLKRRRSR